jgi:hypothetical protein
LSKGPGPGHAHHGPITAQVIATRHAVLTATADNQRVTGDSLTDLVLRVSGLYYLAAELMTQDQARFATGIVAMISMHIAAADANGLDLEHNFSIGSRWHGPILDLNFIGLSVNKGFHGAFLSVCRVDL